MKLESVDCLGKQAIKITKMAKWPVVKLKRS